MTKFKGTPLFGQDSSPQNTSRILSLCATSAFWLVFLLCMIFIHPAEKTPKYNEVKIILSSTPLEKNESDTIAAQKAESSAQSSDDSNEISNAQNSLTDEKTSSPVEDSSAASKTSSPVEKSPVAPKTSVPTENSTTPKSSSTPAESKTVAKNETAPVAAKNTQPVQTSEPFIFSGIDLSDGVDFGTKNSSPADDFDWSIFDNDETSPSSDSSNTNKVAANSSASGSAGETASNSNSGSQQSTSSESRNKNNDASSGTSSALENIRSNSKNFSGRAENGVESNTNVQAEKSGNGKYLLQMQGGKARLLIEPAEPKINLSKIASDTVSSDIDVTVSFSVTQNGLVSEASVSFTPASVLSEIVKKEIAEQLSKWRFESSDAISYASFEYHIKISHKN